MGRVYPTKNGQVACQFDPSELQRLTRAGFGIVHSGMVKFLSSVNAVVASLCQRSEHNSVHGKFPICASLRLASLPLILKSQFWLAKRNQMAFVGDATVQHLHFFWSNLHSCWLLHIFIFVG